MERRIQSSPTKETSSHSPATAHPPNRASLQSRRKDSITQRETFTMIMSTLNQNSPALSITVPPANRAAPMATKPKPLETRGASPKQPQKTVTFVAEDANGEDHKSDASSICQSPSWEGYGQRKKEKKAEEKQRRKDKEQAEKDAKEAKRKAASRLTKKPPSASRTNMIMTGRTTSTPEPPETTTRSRSASTQGEPIPSRRRRSSSVTSQIRAALSGVLGGKEEKEVKDPNAPDFVGGLKLEKEREAAIREAARAKARIISRQSQESVQRPQHPLEPRKAHSFSPTLTSTDSLPSPLPRQMSEGAISGTALPRQKAAPPISMRASSRSETLISPTAPPIPVLGAIEKWRTQTPKGEGGAEEHISRPANREGEEAARGRQGGSYVQHHRKLSHDRAISGFNDETKASAKKYPPQAHRQHHGRAYSITTDSSSPTSPSFGTHQDSTAASRSSSSDRGRFIENLGSFGQPYTPPALDLHPPQGVLHKPPHERSSSRESRGFRGAMQAAFQKVRSSSRPPAAASTFFDRHSRDLSGAPEPAAASRPPSSSSHLDMVSKAGQAPTEKMAPVIKVQDSARPSSSSSSNYDDSLRSPSFMNTPDSSRPQSDRGLPPVVGEVGKGKAETLLITNDERVFRLSHSAQVTCGTPAGPSPITPRSAFGPGRPDSRNSFTRDVLNPPHQDVVDVRIQTEHDTDSFKSCVTPVEGPGSTSSLVPLPLEISPVSSPKGDGRPREGVSAQGGQKAKVSDDDDPLLRAPSLSKSRSSPNVTTDAPCSLDTNQPPLVPPLRSPARSKHPVYQSSVSLPDALDPSAMHPSAAQRSPNPASYLQEARKAAPATTLQRHPRAPRITGGRQEGGVDPLAKMFVECCHCKFFHDMPSRVYECMAHPEAMVEDPKLGVSGAISTVVNCPWCKHGMSTQCCAGYAAVVYLKERLH